MGILQKLDKADRDQKGHKREDLPGRAQIEKRIPHRKGFGVDRIHNDRLPDDEIHAD